MNYAAMTIEDLKIEVARLTSLIANQNAEIAKARGKRRNALIEEQRPTVTAKCNAQRAIVAIRRSEVA